MGKRESCQSVDQVAPGLASQQGVVLGARSQACCHAEAFTGTQQKIEGCWQQVAALIHPRHRLRTATLFSSLAWCRFHQRCWVQDPRSVRLSNTLTVSLREKKTTALLFFPPFCDLFLTGQSWLWLTLVGGCGTGVAAGSENSTLGLYQCRQVTNLCRPIIMAACQ